MPSPNALRLRKCRRGICSSWLIIMLRFLTPTGCNKIAQGANPGKGKSRKPALNGRNRNSQFEGGCYALSVLICKCDSRTQGWDPGLSCYAPLGLLLILKSWSINRQSETHLTPTLHEPTASKHCRASRIVG